ncbi:DUF4263 domain-containing protein [Pantoea allii]|uniref:DUF4263 domain-containing protein n=1 Tax=Pantoea allii TaxID=574096 RepID=A0ABS6VBS3_9GAMM|nr:Shedu anti-phage system protein SduA domain-containing protein [Pantoea allii]MBW1213011.1 DUF4263 domain-containing protein [Pantoea allii]MBW1256671.1 DUF4263 domain-containing protein [Pantoea allii]MBW1265683.1 DUF4263 domain-containing protein [Pantoea allii]MBW1287865.1 DUF4263 domain-containing protein [Pantoea allii]
MKVSDFIFQFKTDSFSQDEALCRVRIFFADNTLYALLTDLDEKSGPTSVTNSVGNIRLQLIHKGFINSKTIIIEHYEESFSGYGSFDIVNFDEDNHPSWKKITLKKTKKLFDCSHEELLDRTLKNERLFKQIEHLYHKLYPFTERTYVEDSNIIAKRLHLEHNAILKKEITDFIEKCPNERELASFLKKDLSFFARLYARPAEEYIIIPELSIANGFVDYVILSGRSRMDVTFIEIKGANFNLMNQSGYGNLSQKTNEAIQQVRDRISIVYRDYRKFRRYFHEVREQVESGTNFKNSLTGPKGKLNVDPDKDIKIRSIVIAGRSINDFEESNLRHNIEITSTPPISLESWDSLINKY